LMDHKFCINLGSHQNNEDDRTNQRLTGLGSVLPPKEKRNHASKKQLSFFINHNMSITIEYYA
jgi:hypothetical protein